jgi:hypothetical protein
MTSVLHRFILSFAAVGLAGAVGAQTLQDLGPTAPTPGTNDASQFSTNGNRTDPDGLNYYTDNQISFGTGEPGQTFLTGTNQGGYVLSSLAIRTAGLGSDFGIGTAQPYYLHLYSVSGSTVTPLQTNTSANITFNDGDWLQWTGLSLTLSPNTAFAWSFGKASSTSGWEAMAAATNHPYAAGQIGLFPPGGGAVTFGGSHSFDAVFDVGLLPSNLATNLPHASTPAVSPSNVIFFGSTVNITSTATGSQPLSYQWQTDGGSGGTLTNIPGATSLSLPCSPLSTGTFQFDFVVTNSFGSDTSAIATVTVLPLSGPASANDDCLVYTIQFNNGWGEEGWVENYPTNFSGSNCLAYVASGTYEALWLLHDPIDTTIYTNLTLWLNGGPTGGQQVCIGALEGAGFTFANETSVTAPANTWQKFTFTLASLGVADTTDLTGIVIANQNTVPSPFYIADIMLTGASKPLVVHVGVNAAAPIRTVDPRVFGINNVAWDGSEDAPGSIDQVKDMGIQALRWPGGSWGDGYHWTNEAMQYGDTSPRNWGSFTSNFINTLTNAHAQAYMIANYGSSTPEEAAYGVAKFNITNQAHLQYWEIGNEVGGSWELDLNTNPPWQPHDPWTYAMRFAQYYTQMKAVDPTIKIGAVADITEDGTSNYTNHPVVNPITGVTHNGWTPVMLTYMLSNNVLPDFLIEHNYAPGDGDTEGLLWASGRWQTDAANLRMMLNDYLGTNLATNIELDITEYGPGGNQQPISLVGGLFEADNIGAVLQTEFNSFLRWDLHNGQSILTDPDNALYGWRTNSSGELLGDGGVANGPVVPPDPDCYPSFYCLKLMQYFARGGDTVITATNDYELLGTYAVRRTNGTLTILVINKSSCSNLTAAINLTGYVPSSNATLYSYGIPQDQAASTGIGSLDIAQTNISGVSTNFNHTFAPYSATVLVFNPAAPLLVVPAAKPPTGQFVFQLQGLAGVPYLIQTSTNLTSTNWTVISTNTPASGTLNLTNAASSVPQFYRAVWRP